MMKLLLRKKKIILLFLLKFKILFFDNSLNLYFLFIYFYILFTIFFKYFFLKKYLFFMNPKDKKFQDALVRIKLNNILK